MRSFAFHHRWPCACHSLMCVCVCLEADLVNRERMLEQELNLQKVTSKRGEGGQEGACENGKRQCLEG